MEKLTNLSKEKVQVGTVTAKRCGEVLDEIVRSVGEVNVMVSEIATASKEQALGVSEINKAMNQMDQVTQANASASQDAAAGAERLRDQSAKMSRIIGQLSMAVEGKSGAAHLAEPAGQEITEQHTPAKGAKVMPFPQKTASAPKKSIYKVASGGDAAPSRDDPRFEEV